MGSKAKVSVRKVMLALLVLLLAVVAFFAYRDIYGRMTSSSPTIWTATSSPPWC